MQVWRNGVPVADPQAGEWRPCPLESLALLLRWYRVVDCQVINAEWVSLKLSNGRRYSLEAARGDALTLMQWHGKDA